MSAGGEDRPPRVRAVRHEPGEGEPTEATRVAAPGGAGPTEATRRAPSWRLAPLPPEPRAAVPPPARRPAPPAPPPPPAAASRYPAPLPPRRPRRRVRPFRLLVRLVLLTALLGTVALALVVATADEPRRTVERGREVAGDVVDRARRATARAPRASCPDDLAGCVVVRGRVVFVEAVDPDGDGDLHVVVADGSITAPGLTSVDVRPGLRPERDPRIGDEVSAAGDVQRGSIGQDQVHAVEFTTAAD